MAPRRAGGGLSRDSLDHGLRARTPVLPLLLLWAACLQGLSFSFEDEIKAHLIAGYGGNFVQSKVTEESEQTPRDQQAARVMMLVAWGSLVALKRRGHLFSSSEGHPPFS